MNVTSRQLTAFLAVARERGFGRAAERMAMTTSGVSALIRELEAQLGFRLFERTTRRVTLTAYGERFLPVAAGSLQSLEHAVRDIARSASASERVVTVGATPTLAASLLPEVLARFMHAHPDVGVRLVDAEPDVLMAAIESGEVDLGLGMFLKPAPGLARTPVLRSPLVAMLPADRRSSTRATLRWSELGDRPLILPAAGNPLRDILDEHRPRPTGTSPADRSVNYAATQASMVEAGFGIAVLPAVFLPAFHGRRLRVARLVDPVVDVELLAVRDRGRRPPPALERFTTVLAAEADAWLRRARRSLAATA